MARFPGYPRTFFFLFFVYIYILDSTTDDNINILSAQLEAMNKDGAQSSLDNLNNTMTVDPLTNTHMTTYPNDDHITHETNITSPHMEEVPHAHIVTLPKFSPTTYGLTLLASKQLRWITHQTTSTTA